MTHSVERQKAVIVWDLKMAGDIEDASGRATPRLHQRLTPRLPIARPTVTSRLARLEEEGLVERETRGKRTFYIGLLDTGPYPDPFADLAPALSAIGGRHAPKSLLDAVTRMDPMHRLAFAGQIIDSSIGEMEKLLSMLRETRNGLPRLQDRWA